MPARLDRREAVEDEYAVKRMNKPLTVLALCLAGASISANEEGRSQGFLFFRSGGSACDGRDYRISNTLYMTAVVVR